MKKINHIRVKSMIIMMMTVIVTMMMMKKKKTLFNEDRNIITGCKAGVVFIMPLYTGLFAVIVSHAG